MSTERIKDSLKVFQTKLEVDLGGYSALLTLLKLEAEKNAVQNLQKELFLNFFIDKNTLNDY